MTTERKDGGAAFPREARINPNGVLIHGGSSGMTLRDYFAGQALAGLVANANLMDHLHAGDNPVSDEAFLSSVAGGAYRYADAMLRAREL